MAAGVREVAGDREVHTFTAGYGPDDRELVNAATVARELGTRHHAMVLDPEDLPDLLPWMVWHLEEPIGREDIAYLVVAAREAARHVELVLTGFGFDGLFAGLPRHRLVDLGKRLRMLRRPLEEFWSLLLTEMWSRMYLDQRGAPPSTPLGPLHQLDVAPAGGRSGVGDQH